MTHHFALNFSKTQGASFISAGHTPTWFGFDWPFAFPPPSAPKSSLVQCKMSTCSSPNSPHLCPPSVREKRFLLSFPDFDHGDHREIPKMWSHQALEPDDPAGKWRMESRRRVNAGSCCRQTPFAHAGDPLYTLTRQSPGARLSRNEKFTSPSCFLLTPSPGWVSGARSTRSSCREFHPQTRVSLNDPHTCGKNDTFVYKPKMRVTSTLTGLDPKRRLEEEIEHKTMKTVQDLRFETKVDQKSMYLGVRCYL